RRLEGCNQRAGGRRPLRAAHRDAQVLRPQRREAKSATPGRDKRRALEQLERAINHQETRRGAVLGALMSRWFILAAADFTNRSSEPARRIQNTFFGECRSAACSSRVSGARVCAKLSHRV